VAELMQQSNGNAERMKREGFADPVLGHWKGRSNDHRILILCHMDTVWPIGTLDERPVRIEDDRFSGPGSFDMKAGIVIALAALGQLAGIGRSPVASVTVLCNGDEEIGSPGSRALVEALGRMGGGDLGRRYPFPWGPQGTPYQWAEVFFDHDRSHAQGLRGGKRTAPL